MRVLQLAARMLSLERFALPLMKRLRDEGFEVEAIAQFDGMEDRLTDAGFRIHDWNAGHTFNPLRIIHARRELNSFLRSTDFDIIHSHCSFGGIIGNPVARNHARHLIYTQHGFYVHEGLNPLLRAAWLGVEKFGLRHADHVICVSRAEQELARTLGVGPPEKFVHVPGAGIDTVGFRPDEEERRKSRRRIRDELGLSEDDLVLLTVSRLTWDKGYREMIDAARMLREDGHDFVFLAAGSGKDEAGIRRAIDDAELGGTFRLLGWRDDVTNLYCAADVFVFASHREGLPIAPLEAMSSGLPVVVADIPGSLEEVEHEQTGLIFATGDAETLAACLQRLLHDARLRETLGNAAREAAAQFDIANVLDRQVGLYRDVASQI